MKRKTIIPVAEIGALLLVAAAALFVFYGNRERALAAGHEGKNTADGFDAPGASAPAVPETLRIATYNIQSFGRTKLGRANTLTTLARVGASFDAMAVQEVGSNGSSASEETTEAVTGAYVARVNEIAGADAYAYVRADQFAVVYRKDRLAVSDWGRYSGNEAFAYPPLVVSFRTIDAPFDFVLVNAHVRPSLAAAEIPALGRLMVETVARYGEKDVVCVGDFNADGSYYDEGDTAVFAGFSAAAFISVVPNDADTTVASGEHAYDRIMLAPELSEDFTGNWAVLKPVSLWDLSACEGPTGRAGTESALSDHYPVWAEFYTGRDTD